MTERNSPPAGDELAGPDAANDARPFLRVISGDLSDEELAALVSVLAARTAAVAAQTSPKPLRSEWGHPARAVRSAHSVGPDMWHRSAFVR